MPADDQLVEVGGLSGGEPVKARSSRISRSGERNDLKVRSTELSTLAWVMALKVVPACTGSGLGGRARGAGGLCLDGKDSVEVGAPAN